MTHVYTSCGQVRPFTRSFILRALCCGCCALQGLSCDHGLVVIGQRLRRVVEHGHLHVEPAAGGPGANASASAVAAIALAEDGGAAEAEVVTEAEWLDLQRVS